MRSVHTVAQLAGIAVLLAGADTPTRAQPLRPAAVTMARIHEPAAPPTGGRSFAIEAAGGVAGSLLGFGLVRLVRDPCNVEDLACILESVFSGIVLSTAASAAGTYLAGRVGETEPSLPGAVLGAVAGAGVGIGLWHLLTEELDVGNRPYIAILSYSAAQGVTSALGSRLLHGRR